MPLQYSISQLVETLADSLTINTVTIKDDTGKFSFRDEDDTAYVDIASNGVEIFDSSNRVKLLAPTLGGDVDLTLPSATGSANQFLQTNGSGVLTFADAMRPGVSVISDLADVDTSGASNGDVLILTGGTWQDGTLDLDDLGDVDATSPNDNDILQYNNGTGNWESVSATSLGNPDELRLISKQFTDADGPNFTLFTPDAGTVIKSVAVRVDTPAPSPGAAPRIAVGTASVNEEYMEFSDNNMERNRVFERISYSDVIGSPDAVQVTIQNTGAKAFTATVFVTHSVPTVVP